MEILYVIGMIAVFVLCLALLSTARRILRSSPLSNGQFGTSRMYDVEPSEDEASTETSSAKMILSRIATRNSKSNIDLVEPEITPAAWYEPTMATAAEKPEALAETKFETTLTSWYESMAAAQTSEALAETKVETAPASWYEPAMAAEEPAAFARTKIDDYKVIDETAVDVSLPSMASELTENPPEMDGFEPPQETRWSRLHKPSRQTYNYALECLLLGVSAWVLIRTQRSALRLRAPQSSDRVA